MGSGLKSIGAEQRNAKNHQSVQQNHKLGRCPKVGIATCVSIISEEVYVQVSRQRNGGNQYQFLQNFMIYKKK